MCFFVACFWWYSYGDVSPYVSSLYFKFGLGCWVTTCWEIAAHSVCLLSSLYFVYLWFWLFPILVLRAGFVFLLLRFLFIAFSLLLKMKRVKRYILFDVEKHTLSYNGRAEIYLWCRHIPVITYIESNPEPYRHRTCVFSIQTSRKHLSKKVPQIYTKHIIKLGGIFLESIKMVKREKMQHFSI